MKIFILKVSGISIVLSAFVLIGMQMADSGIHKIKDPNHVTGQSAISKVTGNQEAGPTSIRFGVKESVIKAKQKKLEEIHAFNLFSALGKKMSEGVSNVSEKLVNWLLKEKS